MTCAELTSTSSNEKMLEGHCCASCYLLRVAARLSCGSRVGVVSGASGTDTYDSRVFCGSCGRAAMLSRDVRARRQAPFQAKLRHSLTALAGGWIRRRRRRDTERPRAGKRRIEVTLCESFCLSDLTASGRNILCLGRGRTDWEGMATRARAKERADWAKAMRRPWRTAAGRRTETHVRRAHHSREQQSCFSSDCFTWQEYVLVIHDAGLCSVDESYMCTSMGNYPRNYQGRGKSWLCRTFCQTVREDMAIVDICMVVLGSMVLL